MSILKATSKKGKPEETKLVGAHVPRQVSDYITLYTLAHGITKTVVIKNEIQHWYKSQMEEEPELIKLIIKKAREEQKKWEGKMAFKKELKALLQIREVSEKNIETILTGLV